MKKQNFSARRFLQPSVSWLVWAAPVVLLAPVWLVGKALFWGTPSLQFVPWRWIAGQMLEHAALPLWNPWSGMGAPLLANYQSALLYPPNWLLLIAQAAGEWMSVGSGSEGQRLSLGLAAWAQTWLVIFHLGWASWGMVRLSQRLGMKPLAQNISALSFGLSGYLVARAGFLSINAAAAWLPWSILAVESIIRPKPNEHPLRLWINSSVSFALLLLAGHAQTAWYILLLAMIWVIVRTPTPAPRRKGGRLTVGFNTLAARLPGLARSIAISGMCGLVAVLLSAAQLLPTAEYLLQSQRAAQVDYRLAMTYSFWPWHFITLLAPGFFGSPVSGDYWGYANYWEDAVYIGILPALLALVAISRLFRKSTAEPSQSSEQTRPLVQFLVVIVSVSFLLALGENTPVFPWLYRHVPTFDMFQAPARFSLWAVFGLALLAGVGVEQWRRPVGSGVYWLRLGSMGAMAVTVGAGLAWLFLGDVSPTFIRAAALAGLWGTCAGLLGLTAPVGVEKKDSRTQDPILRRLLLRIAPLLIKAGTFPEKGSMHSRPMPSWWRTISEPIKRHFQARWEAVVVLVVAVDLLVAGFGLNPGVDLEFYSAPGEAALTVKNLAQDARLYLPAEDERKLKFDLFFRFDTFHPEVEWRALREVLLPNLNLVDGISSVNNFDPLVPGRYDRWMQALEEVAPDQRRVMLNLMSVGVVEDMVMTPNALVEFESLPAARRWRWLPCARFANHEDSAWQQVMQAGEKLLDEYVVIEGYVSAGVADKTCEVGRNAPAQIARISENANFLELQISSPAPGWLLVADTWYPGWRAYVNQTETRLFLGDYLFRAVWLPRGEHTVTLRYSPQSFRVGAIVSSISWLVCLIALAIATRSNHKTDQEQA